MRTETEQSKRVADSRAARYAARTLPAPPVLPELLTGCDLVRGIFRGTAMPLRSGRRLRLKPQYPQSFTIGDVDQVAVVIRENAAYLGEALNRARIRRIHKIAHQPGLVGRTIIDLLGGP